MSAGVALCGVLFDTDNGTAGCEHLGPVDVPHRHAGVVTHGVFRCHSCRRHIGADGCRCPVLADQGEKP